MKFKVGCALVMALLIVPGLTQAQVSPDVRLLQKMKWDGAIVSSYWLQGEARYQKWDNAKVWGIGPIFAMPFPGMEKMEVGASVAYANVDPDEGSSESGISDIDIWGKYQLMDDPLLLAGGVTFVIPGDEDVDTGEFNFEVFSALRHYLTDVLALIGHAGIRINADEGSGQEKTDGKLSIQVGAGLIYEISSELNILGELNFESERQKKGDSDIEITGGVEYALSEGVSLRGGLGIGLDDASPDFEIIAATLFMF